MSQLVRVTRGVWRPAAQVADLPGRCAAMLSGCPDGTVLAGRTAAQLHGLWLPPPRDDAVEVILRIDAPVPRRHAGSRRGEVRGRRRHVHPDEVAVVAGLPVTSCARTWIDLAESLADADLVAAGDSALRLGMPAAELERVIARAGHRRGVVRARRVRPHLDGRSRSRPESHLRFALVDGGLPRPEVNVPIHSELGEWLAEPDLSYRAARLALEYNGAHHADPGQMRRDFTRDFDVQHRGGWRTLTLGPAQVFGRPDQTVRFVRHLLRERAPELLRARPG
jgi:hypothetical protein